MYILYEGKDGEVIRMKFAKKINGTYFKIGDIIYISQERASWFVDALRVAERVEEKC